MSVDPPDKIVAMRRRTGSQFFMASDTAGAILDIFAVRHRHGRRDGHDIARPTSIFLDSTATVLWRHVSRNYKVRPAPQRILAVADSLLQRIAKRR